MLSPDAGQKQNSERERLKAFWAGDRSCPITFEHDRSYCVCSIFYPSRISSIRLGLRAAMMRIAGAMPHPALKVIFYRMLGVKIGRNVFISPRAYIDPMFPWLIEIEDDVVLGIGCHILAHEYASTYFRIGRVKIGKGSVIGAAATIRSGVTIGSMVTVGFNSYVNSDVPDGQTVGGVPARLLGKKTGSDSCTY